MKDIKHIRRDFHSSPGTCPMGLDLGVPWGVEWSKTFFFGPTPRGPREGPKGQISLNLKYKVNFKDF